MRCDTLFPKCTRCIEQGIECSFRKGDLRIPPSKRSTGDQGAVAGPSSARQGPITSFDTLEPYDYSFIVRGAAGSSAAETTSTPLQEDSYHRGRAELDASTLALQNILQSLPQVLQQFDRNLLQDEVNQPPYNYMRDSTVQTNVPGGSDPTDQMTPHPRLLGFFLSYFFRTFGPQFSFLDRDKIVDQVNSNASVPLINTICAIAARHQLPAANVRTASLPFGDNMTARYIQDIDQIPANPTMDAVQILFLLSFYQLFDSTSSSKSLPLLDAASRNVNQLANSTIVDTSTDFLTSLYWTIFIHDAMVSLAYNRKPAFEVDPSVPSPKRIMVKDDGTQQISISAYTVDLMQFAVKFSHLIHNQQNPNGDIIIQLQSLQRDLYDWQLKLPLPLKHNGSFSSSAAPTSDLGAMTQLHIWFYHLINLTQQEMMRRTRMNPFASEGTPDRLQEWAAQRIVDLVILGTASSNPETILAYPLLSVPMQMSLQIMSQERDIATPTDQFLQAQRNINKQLLLNTLARMQQRWPGIGNLAYQPFS